MQLTSLKFLLNNNNNLQLTFLFKSRIFCFNQTNSELTQLLLASQQLQIKVKKRLSQYKPYTIVQIRQFVIVSLTNLIKIMFNTYIQRNLLELCHLLLMLLMVVWIRFG